jgi:MOSC domain-containing protein YiiM
MLRRLNLDGDGQADLRVHGGESKAVYAYPSEHYEFWRGELPEMKLPWGMFGENFTTEGLFEREVCIGDRFRIGEAEVVVTEPRLPCSKLAMKFQRDDIIERFLQRRRTGFYCAVVKEGFVKAGDEIEWLGRDANKVTVDNVVRLHSSERDDVQTLRRAIKVEALPKSWRNRFERQLAKL